MVEQLGYLWPGTISITDSDYLKERQVNDRKYSSLKFKVISRKITL